MMKVTKTDSIKEFARFFVSLDVTDFEDELVGGEKNEFAE